MIKDIEDVLKKMENARFNYFGVRSESRDLTEGYKLEPSHNWDDGTMLEEFLPGTCATGIGYLWFDGEQEDIDTVKKAIESNGGKYGEYIYIIGGDDCEFGNDDGEIIIKDAVVIAKTEYQAQKLLTSATKLFEKKAVENAIEPTTMEAIPSVLQKLQKNKELINTNNTNQPHIEELHNKEKNDPAR